MVWNCLKKVANVASTTVYQVKSGLLTKLSDTGATIP